MSQIASESALRAAFQLGARVTPRLAGRVGWTLFCTPFKASKPTSLQKAVLNQAQVSSQRFGDRRLKVYRWGEEGPVVLMVHGWGGRAHVFGQMVLELRARGMSVVAFDGPAHNGRGGRTNMLEYASALKQVARGFGPVRGMVGHSFGAMTAAFSAKDLEKLQGLALIGAPDTLEFVLGRAQQLMNVPGPVMDYIYGRVEKLSGRPVSSHATSLYLDASPTPLLLVHDHDDKEIPFPLARSMAARLEAEFMATEGLGHHRILNCPQVATRVAEFLEARLVSTR